MKKLLHFIKLAWSVSPWYMVLLVVKSVCEAAKTLLNTVLPMYLLNELIGDRSLKMLTLYTGLIILNNVGMTFLNNTFERFTEVGRMKTSQGMLKLMSEKIMNMEYSYLENPAYLDLKERAVFSIENQNAIANMITMITDVFSQGLTLAGLLGILLTLGPVLMLVLAVGICLMLVIYKGISKELVEVTEKIVPINRRFGYYIDIAVGKDAQKDIRLYNMEEMITGRLIEYANDTCDYFDKILIRQGMASGKIAAVGEGVAAVSYGYVGIRTLSTVFGPLISLGELTMYVSAAINFSSIVSGFGESVVNMMQFLVYLDPYMEFMSLPEETKQSGKVPFTGVVETVEFKNVTFTYPNAEKAVLRNISFAIHKGEKISVVGLNGAGKSTLVKLICRMYQVDSGEIYVNGRNICDYEYLSYMHTISAVFQDYHLFNFSIAENISCQAKGADQKEIERLICEVGLQEKVAELKDGIDSRLGKDYDENGVELSGGQGQKIAIARALYKKASMVILDEPASALDPIAEAEIYEKFNGLVEDKTAIYISHRMSSSVFCDKILIIDDGTVADYDTHENLMKKTDSLYYKLFMSQAENYRYGSHSFNASGQVETLAAKTVGT